MVAPPRVMASPGGEADNLKGPKEGPRGVTTLGGATTPSGEAPRRSPQRRQSRLSEGLSLVAQALGFAWRSASRTDTIFRKNGDTQKANFLPQTDEIFKRPISLARLANELEPLRVIGIAMKFTLFGLRCLHHYPKRGRLVVSVQPSAGPPGEAQSHRGTERGLGLRLAVRFADR